MDWVRGNLFWIVVLILFFWVHMKMHGGHGAHGGGRGGCCGGHDGGPTEDDSEDTK